METVFTDITDYLLKQSWQIALLFAVVAIFCLALKKKTAHLRYLLWLLIIARCLVPSLITVSLAILPQKPLSQPLPESGEFAPPSESVILSPGAPGKDLSPPAALAVRRLSIMAQLAQVRPKTWFSVIWLGGVGLYLIVVTIKAARFNRRLGKERRPLGAGMQKEINELIERFGIGAKTRIWLLDGIGQPFVWGLLKGAIYLPANFGQIGSREHRRGILMHEIAHTLRFDAAVNCLQTITQAIFWFHPLVWLANRNIRAEREKCCDETAIARLSAAPKVYSSAIVDTLIAEYQSTQPIPSLAIAGPIKNIEDRIKTIMKPGKKFYNRPTIIAIVTILLLAIAAIPTTIALTHRQPEKPEEFLSATEDTEGTENNQKSAVQVEGEGLSERMLEIFGKGFDVNSLTFHPADDNGMRRPADNHGMRPAPTEEPIRVRWIYHLSPEGTQVELAAVCRPKEDPHSFWDPAGNPIGANSLWSQSRTVAFELAVIFEYTDASGGRNYHKFGWPKVDWSKPLKVSYGQSFGKWQEMGVINEGQNLGYYNLTKVEDISNDKTNKIRATMYWRFNLDFGIRLVAVDKNGNEYQMAPAGPFVGNFKKRQQMTYSSNAIGLSKKELNHFKLQRRPLAWAEFSDFATEPKKADVEVEVQDSLATESAARRREALWRSGESTENNQKSAVQVEGKDKEAGYVVTGRVLTSPGGEAAAGAIVNLRGGDGKSRTTEADTDGIYIFKNVKPSQHEYVLRIKNPPGLWTDWNIIHVSDKNIEDKDLYLTLPQSVSGTVRDVETSEPVSGAAIRISTDDGRNADSMLTDVDGKFRLYVSQREVTVRCKGTEDRYYPNEESKDLEVQPGQNINDIEFTVISAPEFTGQVLYADGRTAENISVEVWLSWSGGLNDPTCSFPFGFGRRFHLKSDTEGRFIGSLRRPSLDRDCHPNITLKAVAWNPDHSLGGVSRAETKTDTSDVVSIKIILEKTGSATIRVIDHDGKPIEYAKVTASSEHILILTDTNPDFGFPHLSGPVRYLGDGQYHMTNLISGLDYHVFAQVFGYRYGSIKEFVLEPGEDFDAGTIMLDRLGKEAVPSLVGQLQSPDMYDREGAAHLLGSLGEDAIDSLPVLVEILRNDPHNTVRYTVAEALGKMGPLAKEAVPDLIVALEQDEGGGIKREAAKALGLIGDLTAVPALNTAMNDKDRNVRKAAAKAIKKIEEANKPDVQVEAF